MVAVTCDSTPTTQTSPAAALTNVSAPLFAHPVPTKINWDNPRAKHAQVVPTVLLVRPSVRIQQQPALRVLLQVVLRRVKHVLLILTVLRVPPVVYLMPQVVRLVPMPVVLQHVILVVVENTTIKLVNLIAKRIAVLDRTLLPTKRSVLNAPLDSIKIKRIK